MGCQTEDSGCRRDTDATPTGGFDTVPVIDFSHFRTGQAEAKATVAAGIDRALAEVGFFYVAGHGVPQDLIAALFHEAQVFFTLPVAAKQAVSIDRSTNHRGYFGIGRENVDPTATIDLKEGFDIGLDADVDGRDDGGMRGANQWPVQRPTLRRVMMEYYEAIHGFARQLCSAMALAIGLPPDAFDAALKQPESRLRLLHYPPQQDRQSDRRMGAGAHTDCGCLTILAQDDVGGLEVQNGAGRWIAVPPIPGTFVCNVGDFMAFWSNRRFVSTRHRVRSHSARDRYSIPLFLNPDFDVEVAGFNSLRGGATQDKMSVSAYLRQCYDEIRAEPAK